MKLKPKHCITALAALVLAGVLQSDPGLMFPLAVPGQKVKFGGEQPSYAVGHRFANYPGFGPGIVVHAN